MGVIAVPERLEIMVLVVGAVLLLLEQTALETMVEMGEMVQLLLFQALQ
jgi:hypothetical protein